LEVFPDFVEVIVVDDGSTDGTAQAAEAAGARVVRLEENAGKGVALRLGISESVGDVMLFIDADGQDDPAEIPTVLGPILADESLGMVIGSRFQGVFHEGSITPLNRVGNRCITWLFNRLYGVELTDTQAGFRAVRRDAIELTELTAVRYEIETELTLHVLRRGAKVIEVPVSRSSRLGGSTGFEVARDGLRIVRMMATRRFASVLGR
jgi:glycosyltransferase involved in cell wall biosynthesis